MKQAEMFGQQEIEALGGRGILTLDDLVELSEAERRVELLMSDGEWHTATEIIRTSRQREGLRRMRTLRSRGFIVERRRMESCRDFEYRLRRSEP